MASPGQSTLFTVFTELASTTYRKHAKEVADNVSKHNALYRRLTEKGRIRTEDGGLSIVQPLEYASNSTYQRYSGFDVLNINAVDVLSAAEFAWRQVAVNVAASGLEIRTNSGDSRIINFVKAKVKNAQHSLKNGLSVDIYSDGTLANQIGGVQALVADTGTGTVGGINAATFPFWQNIVQSAATPPAGRRRDHPERDDDRIIDAPGLAPRYPRDRHAGHHRDVGRLLYLLRNLADLAQALCPGR